MEPKTTHGKVCRKIEVTKTQTPVFNQYGNEVMEPTVTLNFYVGSVKSEEIISLEEAKKMLASLQEIV